MRILAVDTSTDVCTVALTEGERLLAEVTMAHGQTHAKFLMQAVDHTLSLTRTPLAEVQGFVVGRGPGSFTGLRIGISTVKGLAMACAKPLLGISSLAVLAHQAAGFHPLICPMIDARRNEVYWSVYRQQGERLTQQAPEQVGDAGDVLDHLEGPCTFVGNGALLYKEKLQQTLGASAHWPSPDLHAVRAAVMARLGWQRLQRGEADDLQRFAPVYLRKSDAELNRRTP